MMLATVFTLGYHGLRAEDCARWAVAWEVAVLDTRFQPWSRQTEWRREALSERLGDRYHWVREFGNRRYRETAADAIDLVDGPRGVQIAARLLRSGSILLLCMCPDWRTCHRAEVAGLIHDATGAPIHHLTAGELSAQGRLPL